MPFNVPEAVVTRFRDMGAVRCSVYSLSYARTWVTPVTNCYMALVYFWDAQGREIGYFNRPCGACEVFAPNHRAWSQENLRQQEYADLVPVLPPVLSEEDEEECDQPFEVQA